MIQDSILPTGQVTFEKFNSGGELVEAIKNHNIVVTAGKNALAAYLANSSPSAPFMPFMEVGNKGTTVGSSVASGVTSITVNTDILSGSTGSIILSIGTANQETVTVSAKSGSGPYTYTISATTKAHTAGDSVTLVPAIGDTSNAAALGARVTGTLSNPSGSIFQNVGTFSNSGGAYTGTVYEAGIFSASSGGIMLAHTTFPGITLASGDTLLITWQITFS